MSRATVYTLLSTAAATALFHTLIPDHWLPFVLVGRARGWGARRVAMVAGLSALLHAALSVALGLGALVLGVAAAKTLGQTLEHAGAVLLMLFGVAYAAWASRKGGHFHPGGRWLHGRDGAACAGHEGHDHPAHLHYHADDALIRGRPGLGGLALAVIVGLNPCVLILPILLASAQQGARVVAWVSVAYCVPTVLLMVGLSVLGVRLAGGIRIPLVARYGETASGLLVAALGAVLWLVGD